MKYLITTCLFLAAWCACSTGWSKGDLADSIKTGSLWNTDIQNFSQTFLQGERGNWIDAEKTALRLPRPGITIGDIKLGETIIKVNEGKPESLQIMLYNKGDDKQIDREEFEAMIESAQKALSAITGIEGIPYTPKKGESAVKMKVLQWTWPQGQISLESNSTGSRREFEAEFIRLRIIPAKLIGKEADRASRRDLKSNVKKEGKRVVIEGIPMVDQGQKGYCAVATAARIFGYYGSENVDQHELATIADTSASGGTTAEAMKDAIKKIGVRFQVRIRDIDGLDSINDYLKLIKSYNREAKKMKKKQIPQVNNNLALFWDYAEGDVLKALRGGSPSDVERWMKPIRTWIDNGVPVIWSVQLGLLPEPVILTQTRGGHMRLIIGYDDEKKTILFSDSWGKEHACKEMPMADAAAITTQRFILVPSK